MQGAEIPTAEQAYLQRQEEKMGTLRSWLTVLSMTQAGRDVKHDPERKPCSLGKETGRAVLQTRHTALQASSPTVSFGEIIPLGDK